MKKSISITIICSILVTLLCGCMDSSSDWKDSLTGSVSCKGEIVYISSCEDGDILYVNTPWNASDGLIEVWVYEDTVLTGEQDGVTMQELIQSKTTGAYVTMEIFPWSDDILEGHRLYPAMIVALENMSQ